MGPIESYGSGLPGLVPGELTGKLIVLEGTDGVGRSTQVSLLKMWLETNGRAVLSTETAQSALTGEGLTKAKRGHTLGPVTMSLFYATDLADNLEHMVIPALRAGFVVLTDRYIYSLMARGLVRGMDKDWIKRIHSFALKPDAVFYLKCPVADLIPRVLHSTGFDYWESGMDLRLGETYYDSFIEYQKRLIHTLDGMASEYGFQTIDATRSIEDVFADLSAQVAPIIGMKARPRAKHDGEKTEKAETKPASESKTEKAEPKDDKKEPAKK